MIGSSWKRDGSDRSDAESICPAAPESPDVKRLSAFCLVFVVVLAGCTGSGGGPAAPSTDTVSTPSDLPPGVSANSIDTSALLAAHTSELANRSYTLTIDRASGDGLSVVVQAAAGRTPALVDARSQNANRATYVSDNGSYELRRLGGDRTVRRVQANASSVPTGESVLKRVLSQANFSYYRTVERDGRTLSVFRAGLDDVTRNFQSGRATWFEGELAIDQSGVVHSLSYDLTLKNGSSTQKLSIRMALSNVSETTVSRPDWIDQIGPDANATTRTLSNAGLGTTLSITGTAGNVTATTLGNASAAFYNTPTLTDARVSPLVAVNASQQVSLDSIQMGYDGSAVPGGNDSELFVFVYHPAYKAFVPMETTYDPTNETVRATAIAPNVTVTVDGQTVSPTLDDMDGQYVFAVMHGPTYWEDVQANSTS